MYLDWEERKNARRSTNIIADDRVKANLEVGNKNTMNIVKTRQQTMRQASGLNNRAYNARMQEYNRAVNKLKIGNKGTEVASFPDILGAAQDSGRSITDQVKIMSPEGLKTVIDSGTTVKDAAQTTKSATDAAAAAKMFDGTKAGFAKGMNAIALGAAVIEKWGQRFAKKGWRGIGAGHKQEQLGRGLVEDEMLPF